MDRRSVRPNGADTRRSQEPVAVEDKESRRGVGTTRTVTVTNSQKVVTRRSVAGANSLHYEVDPWETSPKTDYTYSRTRSYLKQPVNDNYISPNMSRQGLRKSASHQTHEYASATSGRNTTVTRNLEADGFYEEEESGFVGRIRGGGVGDGGGGTSASTGASWASQQSTSGDTYMTLRSRTLTSQQQQQQQQQESGNWRSDNTFAMRNMHGTDVDDDFLEVSDTESTHDHRPIGIKHGRSLADQFSSFIVTVVEVCWTVVTYLPRTAISKTSALATGMLSKSTMSNNSHQTTKRQRTTASSSTTTSTATTSMRHFASSSKWRSLRNAVWSVVSFVLITLPVGLGSWAVFGVISAAKLTSRSSATVWQWFESILQSTVTKTTRATDAAILSRTSLPRRRCGCLCLVLFLLLLPLLLFGLLYAASCQREDVADVSSAAYDKFSGFFFLLFAKSKEREMEAATVVTKTTVDINTGGAGNIATDPGGCDDSKGSLLAIAEMEKHTRDLFFALADDHKKTAQAEQDRALSAFRSHLDRLVKMIVQRELQTQKIVIKASADDGRAYLMTEQQKQMAVLLDMQNSMSALAEKANSLSDELKILKAGMAAGAGRSEPQSGTSRVEFGELEEHIGKLNAELTLLQGKYDDLTAQMARWPTQDQTTILIRTKIHEYFAQVMGEGSATLIGDGDAGTEAGKSGRVHPFEAWLNERFTNTEEVNKELELLAADITKEINEKTAANKGMMATIVEATVAAKLDEEEKRRHGDGSIGVGIIGSTGGATDGSAPCTLCDGQLSVEDVLKVVRAELGIYDADKTGKVDYALESAGGSIISVRCSQTYQLQTAQTSVFGIPLWYTYNSPRVVIQPGVHPGECWAFSGSQGYVVVQLARRIYVTEVSIEHIPRSLSPSGRIDSAPKDFGIWGLSSETDLVGVPLGNFTYDDMGTPLQTFHIKRVNLDSFRFVELKVNSNYGQDSYTCLYRFRVHGNLDPSLA